MALSVKAELHLGSGCSSEDRKVYTIMFMPPGLGVENSQILYKS